MNIFDQYLDKIIETIDALNQDHMIELSEEGGVQDPLPKITNKINTKYGTLSTQPDTSEGGI